MRILCIGDIVSRVGRDMMFKYVEDLKYKENIDFVIANGENAAHGNGLTRNTYDELIKSGADIITLGNHTWGSMNEITALMKNGADVIRPLNFNKGCPGEGSAVMTAQNGVKIGIINIIGQTFLNYSFNSPFEAIDEELQKMKEITNVIFVDFHAEATSEKQAMGFFLDGRVSAIFGTHTHVQTADDMILPNGTGYISDLGMTGPQISVLGMNKDIILKKFLTSLPQKFQVAEGDGQFCGCIFDIDTNSGLCTSTKRIFIRDNDR